MVFACCCHFHEACSSGFSFGDLKDWVTPVASILGLLVAAFGIVEPIRSSFIQARISQQELRLNGFYGPFYHLRRKSTMLWQKLKEAHVKDPSGRFSLLEELLKGTSFSDNDKILIDEIVAIGAKCERLILKNAGFMEGGILRDEVLPRAANHYKILRLVHTGKLKGEPMRFSDMTFQAGTLDGEINRKIQALETDLGRLRKQVTLWGWIKSFFAF